MTDDPGPVADKILLAAPNPIEDSTLSRPTRARRRLNPTALRPALDPLESRLCLSAVATVDRRAPALIAALRARETTVAAEQEQLRIAALRGRHDSISRHGLRAAGGLGTIRHVSTRVHVAAAHRSLLGEHDRGPLYDPSTATSAGTSPTTLYAGIGATGWVPPDDNLAASPTEVIEAVNEKLAIWDHSGNPINYNGGNSINFTSFWTGTSGSLGVYDPRITYDPANGGHFIIVGLEQGTNPNVSYLDIAVSTNSSPTTNPASWYFYRVNTATTINSTSYWLDFPGLGYDATALYVTGNLFSFGSNNFGAAKVMTFDKNALETTGTPGGSPKTLTPANQTNLSNSGSLQPAVTTGSASAEYMVEDWDQNDVMVHAITNPLNSNFAITDYELPVPPHGLTPPGAPQEGGSNLVAVNDTRPINAVFVNGQLYFAQTFQNTANGQDKATARWYEIAVNKWPGSGANPTLTNWGNVDPGTNVATFFPSIAVDSAGDIGLSYAESSSTMYPSAEYTVIPVSGSTTTGTIVSGQGYYGGDRWGDYSGIQADPTTSGIFWAVGESSVSGGNWATTWISTPPITPTAVSKLVVGAPTSATAGTSFSYTVTAEDANGNVVPSYAGTVHFTSSDGQAALPADYTFTAGDAGTHTFTVTLKTAGSQSVTVADTANPGLTAAQTLSVSPAAAAKLLASAPSSATAGTSFSYTVTAQDAYGNQATGYTGTVHFTSTDGQAALPTNYTFTATDAGKHTFSVTLKTAGSQSVTATDTANSGLAATQALTVNPAVAAQLAAGAPTSATAGAPFSYTVTAKDAYGNVATGYTETVHFTSSDSKAVLPANYAFTAGDAGVHTFTVTLNSTGSQSVTVTDTSNSGLTATQSVNVTQAAVSKLVVGAPTSATAGTSFSYTVTAEDANGNVVPSYAGTVHFTSSDGQAALPADYTFTAGDAGTHTFTVTLKTAGSQSVTVADTANPGLTAAQTLSVSPAATSAFVLAGYPSPTTAGVAHNFTVTAVDAFGNTTPTYMGTVTFKSSDTHAVLPGSYTFTTADAGVHTFSATLEGAGTQSITVTSTAKLPITGTQSGIVVNAAAAVRFDVTGFANPDTAGASHSFTVTARDAYGNQATGYTGTVHFTSTDGQAVLPADYTFTSADQGQHSFSATLKTAGSQTITATDKANSGVKGSETVTVNPASASKLIVSGYPSPTTHGTSQTFTVTALDAYGNVATGFHDTLKFSSSDRAAVLPANYTFTTADAGTHQFTATLNTVGTQSITATDINSTLLRGSQTGIVVQ